MMLVAAAISCASVSPVPNTPTVLRVLEGAKAAIGQSGGSLPIHRAAANQASKAVLLEMLRLHPDSTKEKDSVGDLPIHWAAAKQASEAVLLEIPKLARVRVRECHRCSLTQMKVDAKDEARLKFMGLQMHEK